MLFDSSIKAFNFKKLEYEAMIEQMVTGGFPSVQGKSMRSQDAWFESYIEARIEKDLSLVKKLAKRINRKSISY